MLYLRIRVGLSFMFYDWLVFAECIFLSIYFTRVGTHGGGIFFFLLSCVLSLQLQPSV